MSFKPVFQVGSDPKYYDNAQRFATHEEAFKSGAARHAVWTMCVDHQVEESDDPVNYAWVDGEGDKMINREVA